ELLPRLQECAAAIPQAAQQSRLQRLVAYVAPNADAGLQAAKLAEARAREAGDYHVLCEALQVTSFLLRQIGLIEEGSEALYEAIELARAQRDDRLLARLYSDYAYHRARADDPQAGLEYIERALALAERHGMVRVAQSIRLHRALVQGFLGEHDAARSELIALRAEAAASGNPSFEAVVLNNLASLFNQRGEPQRALDYAQAALEQARGAGSRRLQMNAWGNRGTALRALARYGEAIASLDNARALAQAMSINVLESRLLKELAQL